VRITLTYTSPFYHTTIYTVLQSNTVLVICHIYALSVKLKSGYGTFEHCGSWGNQPRCHNTTQPFIRIAVGVECRSVLTTLYNLLVFVRMLRETIYTATLDMILDA
jgi:hypothetical protein